MCFFLGTDGMDVNDNYVRYLHISNTNGFNLWPKSEKKLCGEIILVSIMPIYHLLQYLFYFFLECNPSWRQHAVGN
jgi:hypothetical protein